MANGQILPEYNNGNQKSLLEYNRTDRREDLDGVYLVLLQREEFTSYAETVGARPATRGTIETIISYFTESKGEVDTVMGQAQKAGAQIVAASDEDGVYSGYFTDPDGHAWEVLFDGE